MSELSPYTPPSAEVRDHDGGEAKPALNYLVKAGRLLRLLGWITLVFAVTIVAVVAIPSLLHESEWVPLTDWVPAMLTLGLVIAVSLGYLFVGAGVKKAQLWAKVLGAGLGIFGLLNFPIGTLIGIFVLYYLVRGWNEGKSSASKG